MITFDQFMDNHRGQMIDFDGAYGYQCVDLVNQYNKEVIGGNTRIPGNAIDFRNNYPHDLYEWVGRTPGSVPAKGDIVVWGSGLGAGNGHVAVFEHGDAINFTSFDQNFPTGFPCRDQGHNYSLGPVLGWLHPKGAPPPPPPPPPLQTLSQTALAAVPQGIWMPVNRDFALSRFARDHNLQDQLTPERQFPFNNVQYTAQAFLNGIAYCQVGHYALGEIRSVPRGAIATVADPLARAAVAAVPSASWMVVSHDFWLWKFANLHQLQDQQTEEKPFTYQGQPWIVQVFLKGIVYCPVNHYTNAETQLYPK